MSSNHNKSSNTMEELRENCSTPLTKYPKYSDVPVAEKWGCTRMKVAKLNYVWTINSLSFCGSSFYSPQFSVYGFHQFKWRMWLKKNHDWLSLYLYLDSFVYKEIKAKFEFSILNTKGEKTNSKEIKIVKYFKPRKCMGFDNFINLDFLLDESNGLLSHDKLTILCTADFVISTKLTNSPSNIKQFKEPECKLNEKFGNLFDSHKFSDVTLVAEGHELPAHKAILAVRSKVFAAMFEPEMEECKLNRITITDVDHVVLKEMLRFMYTGKAPNLPNMALDLLVAADKYAVEQLKEMCEYAL